MVKKKANHLLVDIGSSSVKIYLLDKDKIESLHVKSLPLKKEFAPEEGLSRMNKEQLVAFIKQVKDQHPDTPLHLYATALFRKMSFQAQEKIKKECIEQFDTSLTILSHDEENGYLELAVTGKYERKEPVLIMNIGGGSTELVIVEKNKAVERHNVDLGVGTVMTEFSTINDDRKELSIEEVKLFVLPYLPELASRPKVTFVTGGELTYMKRADYNLKKNILFNDADHPFLISTKDSKKRNKEIFITVSLKELEAFMPENPTWMHGTRAFLAITDAICEKYQIETVIPSDANLINGIARAHFSS